MYVIGKKGIGYRGEGIVKKEIGLGKKGDGEMKFTNIQITDNGYTNNRYTDNVYMKKIGLVLSGGGARGIAGSLSNINSR